MKPTLLVLAAGLGTRYGGLKQIDSIGPHGETIIDYSIYDAIRAGFGKMVFVIRHYFEDEFRAKVSSKFDGFVETACAYQELDACLGSFALPADRERPWGTGHAILVCRDLIHEPFAVVNADDYYGVHSLKTMAGFLAGRDVTVMDYAMVGYVLRNTLSEHGGVSRGVCQCDEHMLLKKVVECKKIEKAGAGARYLDGDGKSHALTGHEIVSMNLWGFQPSIFPHLQSQFERFLRDRGMEAKAEMYIPFVVDALISGGKASVKVLQTHDTWFGVTYREDRDMAMKCIHKLIAEGIYPERLWE
jgi:UTP-glucose-1-phosphate uridylyltransferase